MSIDKGYLASQFEKKSQELAMGQNQVRELTEQLQQAQSFVHQCIGSLNAYKELHDSIAEDGEELVLPDPEAESEEE
jgi:hypothetical protein